MEIYVFSPTLDKKGVLEDYFSSIWTRRYSKSGCFEIHCNLNDDMTELVKEDDIIWKNDSDEVYYVDYAKISKNKEGKEIFVIKGKSLTSYMDRRIIWGKETSTAQSEAVMRNLINSNVINPTNPDRKINLIKLGPLKNIGNNLVYQASYKNLLGEIERLCLMESIGLREKLDLDNSEIAIDFYKGLDRSSNQDVNPRAIFSEEFESVLEQEYVSTVNDYKNVALIAGEGEGNARKTVSVGEGVGLDRREMYVDARDLQATRTVNDAEVPIPLNEYIQILENRGNTKLAETMRIESFESVVDLNSNLIYKTDYDLGDIVTTISKRWGLLMHLRITEITETFETSGFSLRVAFGDSESTMVEKIKREVK